MVGENEGFHILFNPWVVYRRLGDHRSILQFCQPDCIIETTDKIILIEIKLAHVGDSWKQLRQLYEPVLRAIYPANKEFAFLEIVKWFDPYIPYPETFYYCESIMDAVVDRIGMHIFKPRGRRREANLDARYTRVTDKSK